MTKLTLGLFIIAISMYLLLWFVSYFYLAHKLMFYPPTYDESRGGQYDFVALTHDNGERIQGLWIGQPQQNDMIVLYQHGNAELLAEIVPTLEKLQTMLQLPVFAYEYRGYGGSDGQYSIKNMREDGELAWRYLQSEGFQANNIVIYGRSLGTSNATYLAKQHNPVAGLVLEVPMWDAFRIYADYFWTWRGHLENGRRIKHITAPTFILYAENDTLIQTWHSRKLYQASAASIKERIAFPVSHSQVPNADNYQAVIQNLLQQIIKLRPDLHSEIQKD